MALFRRILASTWRLTGLGLAVIVTGGCGGARAGGQTGEESGDGCEFTTTPLSPRELSPLGFSAEAVSKLAEGEQRTTLRWRDTPGVAYGPERGTSALTLRTAVVGPAQLARVVAARNGAHCQDHLRVPVTVVLATAGGALEEAFTSHLVATRTDEATITQLIPSSELGGTFAFTPDTLRARRFLRLEVDLRFRAEASAGSVLGGLESGDAVSGSSGFQAVPLACWGDIASMTQACAE